MPWIEELPSGKYRARYKLPDGKTRGVVGTFDHKKDARNAAAVAEMESKKLGWRDPLAAKTKWGEWCVAWWATRSVEPGTLKRDASSLKALKDKWEDMPLIDITRHEVKAWAVELKEKGMAPATVQRRIYLLSASLNAAIDAEILVTNPAFRIKLAGGEKDIRRYLTPKEELKLVKQLPKGLDQALVLTLLGTGMRWGEAVGLMAKRVDTKRGIIRIAETWDRESGSVKQYPKSGHIRDVPIPKWLMPHLKARIAIGEERLFPVDYWNWRKRSWAPLIEQAKLGNVRIHDLRHTYASRLLRAGVNLAEVGKLLGHTSPATTQIYAWLAEVPREHVLKALPNPGISTKTP